MINIYSSIMLIYANHVNNKNVQQIKLGICQFLIYGDPYNWTGVLR